MLIELLIPYISLGQALPTHQFPQILTFYFANVLRKEMLLDGWSAGGHVIFLMK